MPKTSFADKEALSRAVQSGSHSWDASKEDIYYFDTFLAQLPEQGGFFIELGGLDGVQYSNSWVLEHVLGWRGMLIEPSPSNFRNLEQNRPNVIGVNAAVCSNVSQVHFFSRPERQDMNTIVEFASAEFWAAAHPMVDRNDPAVLAKMPTITCLPLQLILQFFHIRNVDLLSLDVEGAEFEVVKTLDFKRLNIKHVVIEATGLNGPKDEQVRQYMLASGYTLHAHNDWFIKEA